MKCRSPRSDIIYFRLGEGAEFWVMMMMMGQTRGKGNKDGAMTGMQ